MEKLKKYEDEVDPSTKKKMKEDADSDVKNGKKHDSKAKALVMARVIVAANDKIDTPIPGLLAELAPLKAMKGVKNFEAEAKGNGKFEIYLIASKIKAGDYDIDPEKENNKEENKLDNNQSNNINDFSYDFSEIEILDSNGSPLGEFDGIDLSKKAFIEDKSALGINKVNPRTNLPSQSPSQWAEKQIFDKTVVRIENLIKNATKTKSVKGIKDIPNLEELKKIRNLHFKIENNSTDVISAVEKELVKLKNKYPDWNFTAQFH